MAADLRLLGSNCKAKLEEVNARCPGEMGRHDPSLYILPQLSSGWPVRYVLQYRLTEPDGLAGLAQFILEVG
jgi:hypothetical protein